MFRKSKPNPEEPPEGRIMLMVVSPGKIEHKPQGGKQYENERNTVKRIAHSDAAC